MHWDYRVITSGDGIEYFIAEVYYGEGGKLGWVDDSRDCLRWDSYDHLKSTVEMIRRAFDKPLLRLDDSGQLVEVLT